MLNILTSNKTINIVIEDYAIRLVEYTGGGLQKVKNVKEKAVPYGLIEHGRILDEMEFYTFLKETVREWGIKRRQVRFYVPDSLVIMKKESFPANLPENEIVGHFYMELGQTLYLPFDEPIFDVYPLPLTDKDSPTREGLLFAVPKDEIVKYTTIFEDAGLKPVAADVRALGIYRFYEAIRQDEFFDEAVLFFELNLNSISISIFSDNRPEFLRYLDLDISLKDWEVTQSEDGTLAWQFIGDEARYLGLLDDQMIELERIMNFYRYSLYKGEKMVTRIVLLGDFPNLDIVRNKVKQTASVPVQIMNASLSSSTDQQLSRSFIPALGLALKGEVS